MDVLKKPKVRKSKSMGSMKSTETQDKHVSYNMNNSIETHMYLSTPTSPAKRSADPTRNDEEAIIDETLDDSHTENTPTEDDLERGDDEIRLLELQGLGHLQSSADTWPSDNQGPARKRKRTAGVWSMVH